MPLQTLFYLVICKLHTIINSHCFLWILFPYWTQKRPIICVNFTPSLLEYVEVKENHYFWIFSLTRTKFSLCTREPLFVPICVRDPLFMRIWTFIKSNIEASILLLDKLDSISIDSLDFCDWYSFHFFNGISSNYFLFQNDAWLMFHVSTYGSSNHLHFERVSCRSSEEMHGKYCDSLKYSYHWKFSHNIHT